MKSALLLALAFTLVFASDALAQDPSPGLTIISLRSSTESFLIDTDQNVVKTWTGAEVPSEFAYMLPDSSILRPCRVPFAGGRGGRIQRIDQNDVVVWDYLFATPDYLQHHDIEPMANGNVLLVAWERRSVAEATQAGRAGATNDMKPTYLVEIAPDGPTGGTVVWEWRAWDHLVQDADPTKDNYGVVVDHPELLDLNYGSDEGATWLHVNAIDYNAELDQIVISARNTGEVYVIDHSTTTAEATGHTGGRWGRGGDLLYRWGNPQAYRRGDADDQVLWGPHGAIWIEPGLPGAGNIMVFNNGDRPGAGDDMSSVEEILPPQTVPGVYDIAPGAAYGPVAAVWRYGDLPGFYSRTLSGAYRMPNGNTLICEGTEGRIFEVTPAKATVWTYLAGGPVHRAPRYWAVGSGVAESLPAARLLGNYPNPFNPATTVAFSLERPQRVTIAVFDLTGKRVAVVAERDFDAGFNSVQWSGRDDRGQELASGVYVVRMEAEFEVGVRKISLVK